MTRLRDFRNRYQLPPVRGYTFLGTEASADKPIVTFDGKIEGWFDPAAHVPWIADAVPADSFDLELVDGYLPALRYLYRKPGSRKMCEMLAFAADRTSTGAIHVYVRLTEGTGGKTRRTSHFRLRDEARISDKQFTDELSKLRSRWERFFGRPGTPQIPDPVLLNACKASIIRALITFTGRHPHYGVRSYGAAVHDGFPPTIISLADCLIDWGHAALARDYLLYYFERFVTQTGRVDYYGTSLSEYGQLLSLVRRLASATRSREWLEHLRPKLQAMREWLWAAQSASDTGLLTGVPEADTRDEVDVYFHNNAWCWRGLRDIATVMPRRGEQARCEAFRRLVLDAIAEVTDHSVEPPFIPPVARPMTPFARMTQDRFASYTNYRYWPELLSSGMLSSEQMQALVSYRVTHGGEAGGMTRFQHQADNWPIAHYAAALLDLGQVQDCERLLLSHLAGHMTNDTWTAYEQVNIEGKTYREPRADYCVPAQLIAPRVAAWLARGCPWARPR